MKAIDYAATPDKTCYELWGNDTYSNETYLCGVYASNSSANRARRRHEEGCKQSQSEELRDTFWVTRTSIGQHLQQRREHYEQIELTHACIRSHKAIIDSNLHKFCEFVRVHSSTPGSRKFMLDTGYSKCHITHLLLVIRVCKRSRKPDKPTIYSLYVGIELDDGWQPARICGSETHMRNGTLQEISEYAHQDALYERCHETFYRAIEKYFFGDL